MYMYVWHVHVCMACVQTLCVHIVPVCMQCICACMSLVGLGPPSPISIKVQTSVCV